MDADCNVKRIGVQLTAAAGLLLAFCQVALATDRPNGLDPSEEPAIVCSPVTRLEQAPEWVSGGVLTHDEEHFILVSPKDQRVLLYDLEGRLVETLFSPETDKDLRPSIIRRIQDGYLLEDEASGKLLQLDLGFEVQERYELVKLPYEGRKLATVHDWVPNGRGDKVVLFGDLTPVLGSPQTVDEWLSVVAVADLRASNLTVIRESAAALPFKSLYLMGLEFFAAAEDRVLFVNLGIGKRTGIEVYDLAAIEGGESVFGGSGATVPAKPQLPFSHDIDKRIAGMYNALSNSDVPAGFYSFGSFFIRLDRAEGQRWRLTVVDDDPRSDRRAFVALKSKHPLVMAGGSSRWVILQRGAVTGFGKQVISGFCTINVAEIEQNLLE